MRVYAVYGQQQSLAKIGEAIWASKSNQEDSEKEEELDFVRSTVSSRA